jgi:hypothetical protein
MSIDLSEFCDDSNDVQFDIEARHFLSNPITRISRSHDGCSKAACVHPTASPISRANAKELHVKASMFDHGRPAQEIAAVSARTRDTMNRINHAANERGRNEFSARRQSKADG